MPVYHCYNWSTMVWEQQERIKPITGGSKAGQDERERRERPKNIHHSWRRGGDAVFGGGQTRDLPSAAVEEEGGSWSAGMGLSRPVPASSLSLVSLRPALPTETEPRWRSSLKTTCKKTTLALPSPRAERGGDVFKTNKNNYKRFSSSWFFGKIRVAPQSWHPTFRFCHRTWENGREFRLSFGFFFFCVRAGSPRRC